MHSTKITGILKIQSGLLIEPKCTLGIFEYASENEINKIQNRKIKNKKRNRSRGGSLEGAKIYVTLFPCNECAKAIIQCGIKEVIYGDDKYGDTSSVKASKRMMEAAGVKYTSYEKSGKEIKIKL